MSKVIKFPGAEILSDAVTDVLAEAVRIEWDTLCLVGVSEDGGIVVLCSDGSPEKQAWLLDQGKLYIFGQLDDE